MIGFVLFCFYCVFSYFFSLDERGCIHVVNLCNLHSLDITRIDIVTNIEKCQ